MEKTKYYFVVHDEARVHMTGEKLLEFLENNTDVDGPCEVGFNEKMTDEEFASLDAD
jgi:hypothetical protein